MDQRDIDVLDVYSVQKLGLVQNHIVDAVKRDDANGNADNFVRVAHNNECDG